MYKLLFQRVCAALLIIPFLLALPMQGNSAIGFTTESTMASTGNTGSSTPDACNGCRTLPAMIMVCTIVYCGGPIDIGKETSEFELHFPGTHWRPVLTAGIGLLPIAPDPYPPRISI